MFYPVYEFLSLLSGFLCIFPGTVYDLSRYPMSYMSDDTDLYQYCMRSREYRVMTFYFWAIRGGC